MGHVHLKVGSAAQAARFYQEALGLEHVSALPGAAFLSWGGYHHHFGLNEWQSRGQGQPAAEALGLGAVALNVLDLQEWRDRWRGRADVSAEEESLTLTDPWGNRIRVVQGTEA